MPPKIARKPLKIASQINLDFNPVVNLEEGIKAFIPYIRYVHGTDFS